MLLSSHIEQENEQQNVDFYVKSKTYTEVIEVDCDKCKQRVCLWVLDLTMAPRFTSIHHKGMQRISFPPLRSTRKRLDGHMGYRCACGNNSILASVEEGIVPQLKFDAAGQVVNPQENLDIAPHHEAAVKLVMQKYGDQAKIEDLNGDEQLIDGFIHRRLK